MSQAKRTALTDLLPGWSLARPLTGASLDREFGRSAPRLLDVGVGTGEATLEWAAAHPDHDVVAVELHRPGIARMVQELEVGSYPNVRILETDVTRLLDELVGPAAEADAPQFDVVRVLFPDPWPKKRHRSRRLVDASFVSAATDLLPAGGTLHLATDWDDYAVQMMQALLDEPRLEIDADTTTFDPHALSAESHGEEAATGADGPHPWASPRPERPVTTYERRGIQAGRRITDLLARRRAG